MTDLEALYFTHQKEYLNGTKARDNSFIRITKQGKVTVVSLFRRTISNPKTLSINQADIKPSNKDEFEKAYNDIL